MHKSLSCPSRSLCRRSSYLSSGAAIERGSVRECGGWYLAACSSDGTLSRARLWLRACASDLCAVLWLPACFPRTHFKTYRGRLLGTRTVKSHLRRLVRCAANSELLWLPACKCDRPRTREVLQRRHLHSISHLSATSARPPFVQERELSRMHQALEKANEQNRSLQAENDALRAQLKLLQWKRTQYQPSFGRMSSDASWNSSHSLSSEEPSLGTEDCMSLASAEFTPGDRLRDWEEEVPAMDPWAIPVVVHEKRGLLTAPLSPSGGPLCIIDSGQSEAPTSEENDAMTLLPILFRCPDYDDKNEEVFRSRLQSNNRRDDAGSALDPWSTVSIIHSKRGLPPSACDTSERGSASTDELSRMASVDSPWGTPTIIHAKRGLLPTTFTMPSEADSDEEVPESDGNCTWSSMSDADLGSLAATGIVRVPSAEPEGSAWNEPLIIHAKKTILPEPPTTTPESFMRTESVEPDGSAWKEPLIIHAKQTFLLKPPTTTSKDQDARNMDCDMDEPDGSAWKEPLIIHARRAMLPGPPTMYSVHTTDKLADEDVGKIEEPDGSAWKEPLLIHAKRQVLSAATAYGADGQLLPEATTFVKPRRVRLAAQTPVIRVPPPSPEEPGREDNADSPIHLRCALRSVCLVCG